MQLLTEQHVSNLGASSLVPHFLISTYAYNFLHNVYMTDEAYDHLCKRLHAAYDCISHPHKSLIEKDALLSTTGYYLKQNDFPTVVKVIAGNLIQKSFEDTLYAEFA